MSTPTSPRKVIIIGCGIVGAAAAYFLRSRGVDVVLLDKEGPASAATGAADGAVSVASKRPGPMMTAALAGISVYRQLDQDGLFTGMFKRRSTFIIAASEAECAVLEAHTAALNGAGVKTVTLDGRDLHKRFAGLSHRAMMMTEVTGEGHAIGYQIVHRLLTASGVVMRRGVDVKHLIVSSDNRRVTGIMAADGPISGDAVIVSAGGGASSLLGLKGVMRPRKGQLLVTERAPALNKGMPGAIMSGRYLLSKGSQQTNATVSARGYGLVIDPLVTGQFLIGGTREDTDVRETNDIEAATQILKDAVELVPDLAKVRLLRAFAGVRTAVADGLPLVGRVSPYDNLYVAAGFEGDGICLGPVMSKATVALVCGESPNIDLTAFDPSRFGQMKVAA